MTDTTNSVTDALQPVAWLFQHEETGQTDCIDVQQVEWGFERNNPRWQKISPLYSANTIDTLRAQLAEAQRDAGRLDWIDKQTYAGVGSRGNVWMVGWKGHAMHGLDFRSAIDAAKGESNGTR